MIKPLGKNIVLKKIEQESKSGIILTAEKKSELVIENVGLNKEFKVGQKVILSMHPRVVVEGEFLIVNSEDIIATK